MKILRDFAGVVREVHGFIEGRARIQPNAGFLDGQHQWPTVMDVKHPAGGCVGDDHEAVQDAGVFGWRSVLFPSFHAAQAGKIERRSVVRLDVVRLLALADRQPFVLPVRGNEAPPGFEQGFPGTGRCLVEPCVYHHWDLPCHGPGRPESPRLQMRAAMLQDWLLRPWRYVPAGSKQVWGIA
jgi:hypothetical protein